MRSRVGSKPGFTTPSELKKEAEPLQGDFWVYLNAFKEQTALRKFRLGRRFKYGDLQTLEPRRNVKSRRSPTQRWYSCGELCERAYVRKLKASLQAKAKRNGRFSGASLRAEIILGSIL